ncbi:hypothetical protein [Coleofasciculus sp. FACHB-SPT36]|uniref:TRADD-N-associated membrane domain-containing protein n=1 Tax=Cyanophyceae TaxID=3028117 RepID=UPI00168AD756|nr:hypothetical protein [Coleofasciculus sp. FACHB-SPT36]MBD2538678.1 hypothetical protein [Coleofasciculus sp. FACHB-SPT36]
MNFNFFRKSLLNHQPSFKDDYSDIKEEIIREFLREVRQSYNLALTVTAASALITVSGVGLLYLDKVPEASITTGAGVLASLRSVQFAKDAKEELRQMLTKFPK